MTAPIELAQVWVPLMPEASRIAPGVEKVGREAAARFGRATKVMGAEMAKSMDTGGRSVVNALRQVEQRTAAVEKAQTRAADATGKLRVAETRLEEVASKAKSTASQRASAEEAVARARRASETATSGLTRETRALNQAMKDQEAAQRNLSRLSSPTAQRSFRLPMGYREVVRDAEDAGADAGGSFLAGFAPVVGKLGKAGGPIGAALLAAGGVAFGAGAVIARQVMSGIDQEAARDRIQAQLGVDIPTITRIARAAGLAYANNFGGSVEGNMDTARAAMEAGLLPRDAGASDMAAMIEQLELVSGLLGEEVPAVARSASQAIRTGMAGDAAAAFDLLVVGQQQGLNASQDWLDTLNEYGTQFRKLGLSGPEAVGLMSQALQGGARDTDVAADALKELSIRAVDGSKLTEDSYAALGLNADAMAARFAAGGTSARDALGEVLASLRAMPDPLQRGQVAVGLFGTQAEDLGGALGEMDLSRAAGQFDDVAGAAARAAETAGDNTASGLESARRTIEVTLSEMRNGLATAFGPILNDLAVWVRDNKGGLIEYFTIAGQAAIGFGEAVGVSTIGALQALELLAKGAGDSIGTMGKIAAEIADILGKDELADQWRAASEEAYGWGEGVQGAKEQAIDAVLGLDDLRQRLGDVGAEAAASARFVTDVGTSIKLLPDGKVVLTDNTPEVRERIDQTQYQIVNLADGSFEIVPKTQEATDRLQAWRRAELGVPLALTIAPKFDDPAKYSAEFAAWITRLQAGVNSPMPVFTGPATPVAPRFAQSSGWTGGIPSPPGRARGGLLNNVLGYAGGGRRLGSGMLTGPGTGTSDSILGLVDGRRPVMVSNRESVNTAASTAANWPLIDAMNHGWAPSAQLLNALLHAPRFAGGGSLGDTGGALTPNANALKALVAGSFPAVSSIGGYNQPDGYNEHSSGQALDLMIADPAAGDQINQWLLKNASALGIQYTLWQRQNWKPGGAVSDMEDRGSPTKNHMDHIHVRVKPGPLAAGYGGGGTASGPPLGASTLTASGSGSAGNYPLGYTSRSTAGVDPATGRSGSYTSDPQAVQQAQDRLTDLDADIAEKERALAIQEQERTELAADAAESDRMRADSQLQSARDDLAKLKRERGQAEGELAQAQRGDFTADDSGGESGSTGPDSKGFGRDMLTGAISALGFDGEIFSDPTQWGIWKLFTGGANYVGGILKGWDQGGQRGTPLGYNAMNPRRTQHGMGGSPGPGNTVGDGGFSTGAGGGGGAGFNLLDAVLPDVGDWLGSSATGGVNQNTTYNRDSNNTRRDTTNYNAPVTIYQPTQARPPERMNTRSTGLPG